MSGEPFGASYGETGFGTSDVFRELMSRDPKYVPVKDLMFYQQGLVDTGYLPPTYIPTGNWDDQAAAADRRASRDAFNTARSGGGFASASVQTLFRYLGYTIPTSVFEGVYGIAQGIVADAVRAATNPVEVFEEGGLAGGAVVGAGIGAGIGSVVPGAGTAAGAVVGGIIGGVAGFFGDLFDDDEDEGGTWQNILGALSPIDEIKSGDAKNLFSALSTIMTASAVLKGISVARVGIQGAGGLRMVALRDGYKMAARDEVSAGLFNQFTQWGLKRRVVGSAVLGGTANAAPEVLKGDFSQAIRDFGSGALIGALAGPAIHGLPGTKQTLGKLTAGLQAAPLVRIAAAPAGKVTQALYTGAVGPTVVARAVSELSGGETEIGEDIRKAPDLGVAGTVVDWTFGSLIFPERLLPWRGKDVAKAFQGLGSNHVLLPFARFQAMRDKTSVSTAMSKVRDLMGKDLDGRFSSLTLGARVNDALLQHGIELEVEARIAQQVAEIKAKDPYQRISKTFQADEIAEVERSAIKGQVISEVGKSGDVVRRSELANTLIDNAKSEPYRFQNFLATKGFDLNYWADYDRAQERLFGLSGEIEGKKVRFMPAVKDEYLTAQDFERFGGKALGKGKYEVGEYEARAKTYEKALDDQAKADTSTQQLQDAVTDAGDKLERTLLEMKGRGIIDDDIYYLIRPQGTAVVEKRLINYLRDTAKRRPREVRKLTEQLKDVAGGRYIAVATGENMIDYTHFLNQAEITGIAEYTRTSGFWDTLSSLGAKVDKADLGRLRYNSIVTHMDDIAADVLVGHDGKSVTNAIYDELKARYDVRAAGRRGEELEVKWGSIIRREDKSGKVRKELFKIDPRDLNAEDIVTALKLDSPGVLKEGLDVYEAANRIKRQLHVGAAFGADIAHPLATARALAGNLRVVGLPGFNDFMRTASLVPTKLLTKMPKRWQKGSYGYLPQHLRRAHMAIQFSLSPTFDASRYMEGFFFGKARGGDVPIRAVTHPKKFIHDYEEGWISPTSLTRIGGADAIDEMTAFGDRVLYGRGANQSFDELQLRLLHRGVLGYKPREVEYAQAWWLAQKKLKKGKALTDSDLAEIREKVMLMGQYGTRVTPAGASAHFIFFPYLFSQKQLSAIVDLTLGAPTRNLLIQEGMRRWYSVTGEDGTTMSQDFSKFMEKHVPLATELGRINNLAYGVSPGRFFLEGLMDKDAFGKATQALTQLFVPGGVHQPIGDTTGHLVNLFTPVVVVDDPSTGQSASPVLSLMERLIPAYRDLDRWFFDQDRTGAPFGLVGAQFAGATLKGRGVPSAQMSEYLDNKRILGTSLEAIATNAGYSSWESLRASSPEIARLANDLDLYLGAQFPEGKTLAQTFTNRAEIKDQALYDIAAKEDKTAAEDAISVIGMLEYQAKAIAAQANMTQEAMLRGLGPYVRAYALSFVGDRQFMNLWRGLGFESFYGPLRKVEIA